LANNRWISSGAVSDALIFASASLIVLLLSLALLQGFGNPSPPLLTLGVGFIVINTVILYSLLWWRETKQIDSFEKLRESEVRFRSLVENSQDWLWEVNAEGLYTYCSPQSKALLGYRPDEILGKTPFDLMPLEEAERVRHAFAENVKRKAAISALVNVNLHKNGNEIVMETSATPVLGERGELLCYRGVDRDISERKRAELELRASEQRLRDAQLYAKLGHWELNMQTGKALWSDEVFRILGVDRGVIPGPDALKQFMNPGDWPAFANSMARVEKKNATHHLEYRVRGQDGIERWIECRARPLATTDGKGGRRLVGVIQDISERKQAEVEKGRLQRELQQAHKMEALGQLAGGIAHDFNNLLGIINGYSELAVRAARNVGDDRMIGYLEHVENAGERARKLVLQLLTFSRNDAYDEYKLQLLPLIREDLKMLRATLPTSISIELEAEEGLPNLVMDPVQLQQLLLNLSINARDAMEGGGRLTIGLKNSLGLDAECAACHRKIGGDWIELFVSDTGGGISADMHDRVFDPFFTTKPVGQGTGMGLALVDGIVHRLGGHILFTTDSREGFTICLLFPPLPDKIVEPEEEGDRTEVRLPRGDGERVLVVDDEPELAECIGEILSMHGFQSVVTDKSSRALEIFSGNPQGFDLLVSDQTMPEITGIELVNRLREFRPDIPAILCSGFSDLLDEKTAQRMGCCYLPKPIDSSELIRLSAMLVKRV